MLSVHDARDGLCPLFQAFSCDQFAAVASLPSTYLNAETAPSGASNPVCNPDNTAVAQVVALKQVYVYNRFGAFNPGVMLRALRRDVVVGGEDEDENTLAHRTRQWCLCPGGRCRRCQGNHGA